MSTQQTDEQNPGAGEETEQSPVATQANAQSVVGAKRIPMQKTKEQERAARAWKDVRMVQEDPDCSGGRYKAWVKRFPMLVLTNGLGQALAFTRAKGKEHHLLFYRHISEWVLDEVAPGAQTRSLLEWLMDHDSSDYRRATTETLAFVNWLKRFAEAEIEEEEEGEDT